MILAALVLATTVSALPEGEAYVFSIEALGSHISKGAVLNGAADMWSTGSTTARPGEVGYAWVTFGALRNPRDLCMDSSGSVSSRQNPQEVKREFLLRAPHLFWAEFRPEPAEFGKVRFELSWERWLTDASGRSARIGGDRRMIEIREGQDHYLDFVSVEPSAESYCSRNVLVKVTAGVHESPSIERSRVGYDLWLRHTDAGGKATTRRVTLSGKQGEEVRFEFEPLRFPTDVRVPDDGDIVEASVRAAGAVRGRVRPDGSIELRLGATRWTSATAAGDDVLGGIGEPGEKVFTVRPGETVSVPFPPAHGKHGVPPKVFKGQFGTIDAAEVFAGHTDELILTVTRER